MLEDRSERQDDQKKQLTTQIWFSYFHLLKCDLRLADYDLSLIHASCIDYYYSSRIF